MKVNSPIVRVFAALPLFPQAKLRLVEGPLPPLRVILEAVTLGVQLFVVALIVTGTVR